MSLLIQEAPFRIKEMFAAKLTRCKLSSCDSLPTHRLLLLASLEFVLPFHLVKLCALFHFIIHGPIRITLCTHSRKRMDALVIISIVMGPFMKGNEVLIGQLAILILIQVIKHLCEVAWRKPDRQEVKDELELPEGYGASLFDVEVPECHLWLLELNRKLFLEISQPVCNFGVMGGNCRVDKLCIDTFRFMVFHGVIW
jgi:hypothetical protein